ncbi:MAG TPA: class I SAM-dependent rRNA methyltransferase [Terracidiphilus sp.]|jgi:23S rRNA (cytosine1962-C5)-methyltransferase
MTKANKPKPDRKRRAPAEKDSGAPSERSRTKPGRAEQVAGRQTAKNDSKRIPYSANTPEHIDKSLIGARISRRAADRLRAGHVWVYASDVESLELGEVAPGKAPALLPVADYRGVLLGTALYSPASQIALRLVSREAIGEAEWLELLGERLSDAIDRRVPELNSKELNSDAFRLCFSEADEIPGLVVDKYGELVIVQLLAKGLDSAAVRERIVSVLRERIKPASILERPDPRIRELEELSAPSLEPLYAAAHKSPLTATQFRLNGLTFQYDANSGQKTGAFLDQHANYKAAEQYAWKLSPGGRALDVCTYQGGFALHLARVSKSVTGIDTSHASLEVAERNLAANRDKYLPETEVDWVEGDAFQILRDWAAAREQFDTIVLDPPAFAKSKRAVEGALRGYKELNLRAMQMLKAHGLLVTCSCSHHVSLAEFEGVVAAAAADAHRRLRRLARRGAAPDHPVVLNIPETEYLKCLVLEVE